VAPGVAGWCVDGAIGEQNRWRTSARARYLTRTHLFSATSGVAGQSIALLSRAEASRCACTSCDLAMIDSERYRPDDLASTYREARDISLAAPEQH